MIAIHVSTMMFLFGLLLGLLVGYALDALIFWWRGTSQLPQDIGDYWRGYNEGRNDVLKGKGK